MLVLNRFVVAPDAVDGFTERAHAALAALAARPGYLRGRLTRALDEPDHWSLVTEWESVGSLPAGAGRLRRQGQRHPAARRVAGRAVRVRGAGHAPSRAARSPCGPATERPDPRR